VRALWWGAGVLAVTLVAAALAYRRTLRATLEREEGKIPYIYRDSAGYETFGIGHKVLPNDRDLRQYSKANPAPDAVVYAYLDQDIARAQSAVDALPPGLSGSQRAALVSLIFNIGVGAFERSTLRALLVAGDTAGAADEFLRWKLAGGQPVLLSRRERERELFLSGAA
jgi:lysozyme